MPMGMDGYATLHFYTYTINCNPNGVEGVRESAPLYIHDDPCPTKNDFMRNKSGLFFFNSSEYIIKNIHTYKII